MEEALAVKDDFIAEAMSAIPKELSKRLVAAVKKGSAVESKVADALPSEIDS